MNKYFPFPFHIQHVQVQLEAGDDLLKKTNLVFSRSPPTPIGRDGKPLRTSVCNEIEDSVAKASNIERQLQNSKVT